MTPDALEELVGRLRARSSWDSDTKSWTQSELCTSAADAIASLIARAEAAEARVRELEAGLTPIATAPKDGMKFAPVTASAARQQGFTGNICSSCGSVHMQIAGHCEVCSDCGTTTGCS